MAEALRVYETIGQDQIQDIMAGRPAREPAGYRNNSNKEAAQPSQQKTEETVKDKPQNTNNENKGTVPADGTSVD